MFQAHPIDNWMNLYSVNYKSVGNDNDIINVILYFKYKMLIHILNILSHI